jgi:hypothetical protein
VAGPTLDTWGGSLATPRAFIAFKKKKKKLG